MRSAPPALVSYLDGLRANRDVKAICADLFGFYPSTASSSIGSSPTYSTTPLYTFTNADVPITYNGSVYLANSVLIDGLRFKCSNRLDVDQQQITVSARSMDTLGGVPFLQAVRNRVLDGYQIIRTRVFLNSWSPADTASPIGGVTLFQGRVGNVDSVGRTTAKITVNSELVLLDLQMPRNLYASSCQHVVYDSGCALIKSAYGTTGTVAAGSTNSIINWSRASGSYAQGTLTFTSGVNTGVTVNIKNAVAGASLTLAFPLLNAPSTGDAFTAYFGCDHTIGTCQGRFNNLANFRGFPFVPPVQYAI